MTSFDENLRHGGLLGSPSSSSFFVCFFSRKAPDSIKKWPKSRNERSNVLKRYKLPQVSYNFSLKIGKFKILKKTRKNVVAMFTSNSITMDFI